MLHTEIHVFELAVQPAQCPKFPLTDSQGALQKHGKLVAKFPLRQAEFDFFW